MQINFQSHCIDAGMYFVKDIHNIELIQLKICSSMIKLYAEQDPAII